MGDNRQEVNINNVVTLLVGVCDLFNRNGNFSMAESSELYKQCEYVKTYVSLDDKEQLNTETVSKFKEVVESFTELLNQSNSKGGLTMVQSAQAWSCRNLLVQYLEQQAKAHNERISQEQQPKETIDIVSDPVSDPNNMEKVD